MAWKKSSEALVAAFGAALPDDPAAERRQMFGYPCAFTGGQMFSGLHEERLVVRLPEEGRRELGALGGQPFEPMPGRAMKEYVVVPAAIVADPAALRAWIARAFAYGRALPAKEPKGGKAAAKKPATPKATAKKPAEARAASRAKTR